MKGDGLIKKITIKYIGTGYKNYYQVFVKIYDECNNLIYEGYSYDGEIKLLLEYGKVYRLESFFLNEIVNNFLLITNENIYIFVLNNIIYNPKNTVTFYLTDFYYKGLKIEKGELLLWQK